MERETPDAATAARALEAIGEILAPPGLARVVRAAVHAAALSVAAATAPPADVMLRHAPRPPRGAR
jgi:hypothetical protein